ncbi:MAG: tRNA (adenosine(37)-N6)-threonylcarbamoyltransferase complex ATPase subunit type 1 TsaE [Acidimicrobiales bacterium]
MIVARSKSPDDTRALAAEVAPLARPADIVVLAGDLGVGKTVFAQGFGRGLGVTEAITSPTFTLVRSYEAPIPLLHLDVYRLDHLQELVDLGLAELLDTGRVALIEWGDLVTPALPADFLEVRLEMGEGEDDRLLRVRSVGSGWSSRLPAVQRAVDRWVAEC